MNLRPDIVARIRFFTTDEGGRKSAIPPGNYGCPIMFGNEGFDGRLLRGDNSAPLDLGVTSDIPVKFLSRGLVEKHLRVGARFKIWEGKRIGEGEILKVFEAPPPVSETGHPC